MRTWGHMEIESTHCYCGSDPQMVNQLIDKYTQDNEIYLIDYIYFSGKIERIAYKSDDIVDYDGSPALHGITVTE